MITTQDVCMTFGSRTLFDGVTLAFAPGQRYALTGPNGSGKSTFMRLIMGVEKPTSGVISLPQKVGMLRQNIEDFRDLRVRDVALMGNAPLWAALQERDRLYEGEMSDAIGMRLGDLEEIIARENGYNAESDAEVLLQGLHISGELHEKTMQEIPLALQFRVLLCQALFGEPDALLLDEPTNHLDFQTIRWLEEFLLQFRGALIVTSHNRHFLNQIATQIADIDYETIIVYPGNYDAMVVAKTASREREEASARSREKKIAQLRDFVARFGAGTRASQVQSRQREMQRLQPADLKKTNIQRPYIRLIPSEKTPGQIAIKAESIAKSYGQNTVIERLSLEVHRGDKIGVIGNNGAGKTTLLKILAGQIAPDRGNLVRGHNAKIAYFPQDHAEVLHPDPKQSAYEWLRESRTNVYDQEIRGALGKLLFSGDDAHKSAATLSGGERARLILAQIMLADHNVLIFDEPNNHLDLEAVSALSWGLAEYPGVVIVASHDQDLIGNVATRILAFEEGRIRLYDGGLEGYLAATK